MSEPNWAQLLQHFYEKGDDLKKYGGIKESLSKGWNHQIIDDTGLSGDEVYKAIVFLENKNLIERDNWGLYYLTQEGFEIAHEREIKKEEQRRNDYIALFTAVLAVVGSLELVMPFPEKYSKIGGLVGIAILGGLLIALLDLSRKHHSPVSRVSRVLGNIQEKFQRKEEQNHIKERLDSLENGDD